MSYRNEGERWQHTLRLIEEDPRHRQLHEKLVSLARHGKANQWIIEACLKQMEGRTSQEAFTSPPLKVSPGQRTEVSSVRRAILEDYPNLDDAGGEPDEPTYEDVEEP